MKDCSSEPAGTIFYDYQGQGWYDAALPLAFAYQMTGDTKYSDKLIALVQEMLRPRRGRPFPSFTSALTC